MKYLFGLQWSEKPTNGAFKPRTKKAKAKIVSHADDWCVCSLNLPHAQWDNCSEQWREAWLVSTSTRRW